MMAFVCAGRRQPADQIAFHAKPKRLVVDELGCLPLEKQTAHLFCGRVGVMTIEDEAKQIRRRIPRMKPGQKRRFKLRSGGPNSWRMVRMRFSVCRRQPDWPLFDRIA